jgi:hypothetical protein
MSKRKWSQEDIEFLSKEYPHGNIKEISNCLVRSEAAIKLMAARIGISRDNATYHRGTRCHLLNTMSLEALYWVGFILADGHISDNRLVVAVAEIDKLHLAKLSSFLNCTLHRYKTTYQRLLTNEPCIQYRLAVKDIDNIGAFVDRWEIHQRKTYNPPSLCIFSGMTPIEQLAVLIGFIDGDGCIIQLKNRSSLNLIIKNHVSWFPFLNHFKELIITYFNIPSKMMVRIVNAGKQSELRISKNRLISRLLAFGEEMDLPMLRRKWNKILTQEAEQLLVHETLSHRGDPVRVENTQLQDL